MPRRPQFVGEFVYHVINRAATQMRLFTCAQDYIVAQQLLFAIKLDMGIRLLAYCIMPNHWHLILWPRSAGEMSQFLQSFTGTHAQRWRATRETIGCGAVYQGRYKAFPIQTQNYFLNACRYVERNPLRAGLVRRAEEWPWSSCALRHDGKDKGILDRWPLPCPDHWLSVVNGRESDDDLNLIREAIKKGIPLGDAGWVEETARIMGVSSRLRHPGRPATTTIAGNPSRPLLPDGEGVG